MNQRSSDELNPLHHDEARADNETRVPRFVPRSQEALQGRWSSWRESGFHRKAREGHEKGVHPGDDQDRVAEVCASACSQSSHLIRCDSLRSSISRLIMIG